MEDKLDLNLLRCAGVKRYYAKQTSWNGYVQEIEFFEEPMKPKRKR